MNEKNSPLKKKSTQPALHIGALAGAIDAFLTHPLGTLKTWYQSGMGLNTSDPTTLLTRLYRGVLANMLGMGTITMFRVFIRNNMLNYFFKTQEPTLNENVVSAVTAGGVSSILTSPLELGVTLQQIHNSEKKPKNFVQIHYEVFNTLGVRKGFTGIECVAARDCLVTLGSLTLSNEVKEWFLKNHLMKDAYIASMLAGAVVGTVCTLITHPLDTIKTIQHVNVRDKVKNSVNFWGKTSENFSHSSVSIAKQIVQNNGYKGFFRGVGFRIARVAPHTAIVSTVIDQLSAKEEEEFSASVTPGSR